MERTLIILKPDCMKANLAGAVLDRFAQNKFRIVACKMIQLTEALLKDHYAHIASKPFFPEIVDFMSASPVVVVILEGEKAIDRIRDLLGPTDSTKAEKGTIRGDMGQNVMMNIAHASDSQESAQAEIKRFFKSDEVFA